MGENYTGNKGFCKWPRLSAHAVALGSWKYWLPRWPLLWETEQPRWLGIMLGLPGPPVTICPSNIFTVIKKGV